ncbi:MAG: hypothetical protein R3Y04_07425, partial [Rikenellaceae bacterium]
NAILFTSHQRFKASPSEVLVRCKDKQNLQNNCSVFWGQYSLTKYAAFKILGRLVPYAGYTVAAADFANCMGWLNWW